LNVEVEMSVNVIEEVDRRPGWQGIDRSSAEKLVRHYTEGIHVIGYPGLSTADSFGRQVADVSANKVRAKGPSRTGERQSRKEGCREIGMRFRSGSVCAEERLI
jgi:hypothetical protein